MAEVKKLSEYTREEVAQMLNSGISIYSPNDLRWELIYRRDQLLGQIKGTPDIQV